MTVFNSYFKILKKQKAVIIMYTVILLFFTVFNMSTSGKQVTFSASKPDVMIVNKDTDSKIVSNFKDYLSKVANVRTDIDEDKVDDAIFYGDIGAAIYINDGYTETYLSNNENNIEVKYGTEADSSYAKMIIEKYFKVANTTNDYMTNEDDIIETINKSLDTDTEVSIRSSLDTSGLSNASYFYTFSNYSILSICIYITALILIKFNDSKIKKRNIISSKKNSSIMKELYLANMAFVLLVWGILVILSFIIVKRPMFTTNGLLLILNSFIFTVCALSIGFLCGNLCKSENSISAIVNVVGLGSSFICGAFIPAEFLPSEVLKYSHILPSYWYINNNNIIKNIETFNIDTLKPVFEGMGIILLFAIAFFIITNIISRSTRKSN